jgi:hypothetical protein
MGSKIAFAVSCGFLVFLLGVGVGHYRVFPYSALEYGKTSLDRTITTARMWLGGKPTDFMRPARYAGRGVTQFLADLSAPGITLLSGFFDGEHEIRLVRSDGSVVHRWLVRLSAIFPDTSHVQPAALAPASGWGAEIHGAVAMPDGSVVFNFEPVGPARLDRCGNVVWTVPRRAHHSLERSETGGFWVPSQRYIEERSPFPSLAPPYFEETVLRLSDQGQILQEISVPGLLFKNELQALLFANGRAEVELISSYPETPNDITHLNDVEELSSGLAPHFQRFAPGDLMLSLRSLNLVLVVDPATERVKWHQVGPWLKQHDPDFQPDGTVTVFNNNDDGTATGDILGGSEIVAVNPDSGETTIRYGATPDQRFFTDIMGKHQQLDNGNLLITESTAGRVLEVTPDGQIAWEFVNRYDDDEVAIVTQATRYAEGYFTLDNWECR